MVDYSKQKIVSKCTKFQIGGMPGHRPAGVKGKLCRFWYELNKETDIKVKTGVGITKVGTVGETVDQGSIG